MIALLAACAHHAHPAAKAKAVDPSQMSANVYPGESVGPIHIGNSEDEVRAALGPVEVEKIGEGADVSQFMSYQDHGLSMSIDKNGHVDAIHAYSGRAGGYEKAEWRRFDALTNRGITFDSKYDDVIAAYGQPDKSGELTYAPIPSKWIHYNIGIQFDFITATNELITIAVFAPQGEGHDE
jgi:hypothetical protein